MMTYSSRLATLPLNDLESRLRLACDMMREQRRLEGRLAETSGYINSQVLMQALEHNLTIDLFLERMGAEFPEED